jgi:hypothetical protein
MISLLGFFGTTLIQTELTPLQIAIVLFAFLRMTQHPKRFTKPSIDSTEAFTPLGSFTSVAIWV